MYMFLHLRHFNVQTDHVIEHRRPDVVVLDKHDEMCRFIDVASKENEKVQKYQDLVRELRKLWQVKVKVVPAVVGALGIQSRRRWRNILRR